MDPTALQALESIYDAGYGHFCYVAHARELLGEVAASRDLRATPWLLPIAHSKNSQVAHAARLVISELLGNAPLHRLPGLEECLKGSYQLNSQGQAYRGFSPKQLLPADARIDSHTLGLASFHPNGHVRQKACELLDIHGLRYLLLRANDWVPEVRTVASRSLARLATADVREWTICLPLVERLRHCGRADHEAFVQFVEERLKLNPEVLLQSIGEGSRQLRSLAYKLVIEVVESPSTLLFQALKDRNVSIRNWALEKGLKCLEDSEDFLAHARRNKAPSVRYKALLRSSQSPDLAPFIEALLDKNRSVREYAQFVLKKHGFDLENFYRERLSENPQAILGLTEIGSKPEQEAVGFLDHSSYCFQKAAIQALCQMGSPQQLYFKPLLSQDPRVSKRAARALAKKHFSRDRLWTLREETKLAHVRENIGWLLMNFGRWWERQVARVRLIREADSPLRELAIKRLQERANTGAYLPPESARQYIQESLPLLVEVLGKELLLKLQSDFGVGDRRRRKSMSDFS